MKSSDAKIVGMMLVRNEDWIVKATLLVAMEWLDEIVILDDGSTDHTPDHIVDVCRRAGTDRVHYYREDRNSIRMWREMDMRQRLFDHTKKRNPTHYAIIDADEIPVAPLVPYLRDVVAACNPGYGVSVPMHSPYGSMKTRRVDGSFEPAGGIFIGFRETPGAYWQAADDGYQHHARCPRNVKNLPPAYRASEGGIAHMQFVSRRRLEVKAAYYKALETVQYPGRMTAEELNKKYDWTLRDQAKKIEPIPDEWWAKHRDNGYLTHIDLQKDPWQYDQLRILLNEHGRGTFIGLDMHGVV